MLVVKFNEYDHCTVVMKGSAFFIRRYMPKYLGWRIITPANNSLKARRCCSKWVCMCRYHAYTERRHTCGKILTTGQSSWMVYAISLCFSCNLPVGLTFFKIKLWWREKRTVMIFIQDINARLLGAFLNGIFWHCNQLYCERDNFLKDRAEVEMMSLTQRKTMSFHFAANGTTKHPVACGYICEWSLALHSGAADGHPLGCPQIHLHPCITIKLPQGFRDFFF